MPGRIPENVLEDILSRVDIAEVIASYIPLKRAGRNFRALCPFHHEKTPSFMVSPDRQIYHCFGCGESGNAFKFLMRYERLEFFEAVQALAKKAGVVLPQGPVEDSQTAGLVTQLYKVNELAASFFANNLSTAEARRAKDYLLKRGILAEGIKAFKLGFAQDKWDSLINYLRSKGQNISVIEKAGLILSKDNGGFYDRFRNRIIFPITDIKERIIGFGARVLDDSLPKYVNSPETQIYIKGKNLYGLNLAKDSIREKDFAVVVEGYLDFLIPFQEGIKNIVASSGTALTPEQVRLLKRYTHNVVMVYDGDAAGQMATLRSLDIFIEEEMEVRVVSLPEGFDPDSFVRKYSVNGLKEKIDSALGLFDYKLKILKARHNSKSAEDKAKISSFMLETIAKFKNAVIKSEYLKRLAQELDVSELALLEDIKKVKEGKSYTLTDTSLKRTININPTEKLLLKLMLEENEFIHRVKEALVPADFQDERTAKVVSAMFELASLGRKVEPSTLMNHFSDEDISGIICESMFLPEDLSAEQREKIISDCIKRLKSQKIKLMKQRIQEQIKNAQTQGDEKTINNLMEEFQVLIGKGE